MPENAVGQIIIAEERLRIAMLESNVASLDTLIAPSLIYTTHFGTMLTKEQDLEVHRSGALKFHEIELADRKVLILDNVAYVSVRARLAGVFFDNSFQEDVRFSRIWQWSEKNSWRVIVGQATVVQG